MARPRKPTASLELNGAFRKNPNRRRKDPPTGGPLGDPPASLPVKMHATWYELAHEAPMGVLTCADRAMFEDMVRLKFERRTGKKWTMAQQAAINWLYSRCGMTPSDRSKVHAPKEKETSPFSRWKGKVAQARSPKPAVVPTH